MAFMILIPFFSTDAAVAPLGACCAKIVCGLRMKRLHRTLLLLVAVAMWPPSVFAQFGSVKASPSLAAFTAPTLPAEVIPELQESSAREHP
jgi:hypothetical protein